MFPFFFHQKRKTPEEGQQERIVQDARQLTKDLSSLTPEVRAKFWADIEGHSPGEAPPTGDGKKAPNT